MIVFISYKGNLEKKYVIQKNPNPYKFVVYNGSNMKLQFHLCSHIRNVLFEVFSIPFIKLSTINKINIKIFRFV